MKISSQVQRALASQPFQVAAGVVLVVGAVYWISRRTVKDVGAGVGAVADAAGGVLTGNNAITQGTSYEGAGVLGTLGSGVNEVLGGVPEKIGSWIGGKVFDWFGPKQIVQGAQQSQDERWKAMDSIEGIY